MDEIRRSASPAARIDDLTEQFRTLFDAHLCSFQRRLAHVVVFLLEQRRLGPDIQDEPAAKVYMAQRRS